MSLKDKLEVGLKPDAPYRPDNLPAHKLNDPACQEGGVQGSDDDPDAELARQACDDGEEPVEMPPGARRPTRRVENDR